MLNFRNKEAQKEIADRVRVLFEKVEVHPGHCRYNFRCTNNSVHEAIENGHNRIAQVIYISSKDYPIIHYVNVDRKGRLIDNTLGHNCTKYDFYLVKMIHRDEFDNVETMLKKMRKVFQRWLSPINRWFSDYTG